MFYVVSNNPMGLLMVVGSAGCVFRGILLSKFLKHGHFPWSKLHVQLLFVLWITYESLKPNYFALNCISDLSLVPDRSVSKITRKYTISIRIVSLCSESLKYHISVLRYMSTLSNSITVSTYPQNYHGITLSHTQRKTAQFNFGKRWSNIPWQKQSLVESK
jgi:hypothetical protein